MRASLEPTLVSLLVRPLLILSDFYCVGISVPSQSVRSSTTERHIFSEGYDQQLSELYFGKCTRPMQLISFASIFMVSFACLHPLQCVSASESIWFIQKWTQIVSAAMYTGFNVFCRKSRFYRIRVNHSCLKGPPEEI